jgi:xanthine dehydrogenase accessory factor
MHSVEEELARRLALGEEIVLATVIKLDGKPPSRPGAKLLMSRTAALAGTLGCSEFDAAALDDSSIEAYLEPHATVPTLVVFGATPVARVVVEWAPELGFRAVLVETRGDRLKDQPWPAAVTSLDDLAPMLGSELYAVHTDHDAADIVAALEVLLPRKPRFIGLVGSRRHTGHHMDALRAKGVKEDVIAQIQSPVGLDIGGQTPAEIAISILAGLVARRRGRHGGWLDPTQAS